jgi:Uma2 family endonuclease
MNLTGSWIVNARKKTIQIFRDPSIDGYSSETTHSIGDHVSPPVLPKIKLRVRSLFQIGK